MALGKHTSEEAGSTVDVSRAEQTFNQLSRQLSLQSTPGDTTRAPSRDVEKAEPDEDEQPFDLRDYLSSSNDANTRAGIRHKHVGVTWDDLCVQVAGGADSKIIARTFGKAVVDFWLSPYTVARDILSNVIPSNKEPPPLRSILHSSSGVLKPGEMCLVLGCPGAGCTTFLKAISNERAGYASISGDIRYAGIDSTEMAKTYKGEVVYNEEDDIHIATLTVAQTLQFALSTKTPGPDGRLPGLRRKQFDADVLQMLLKMLNIQHTEQTLVGNEFVRGVSGGERKRVSIAEMMATRARVQCWDNSTRGLDASTALDFVKSLRVMTDVLGQTTFVTLYQAGEGIYDLFDKVLVLDEGHTVYYGSPKEARAYFEQLGYNSLPRQTTPDYLTGCTDPNERQFAPGRSAVDVPSSPEALSRAFLSSTTYRGVQDELDKYKLRMESEREDQEVFRAAVAAEKKKGVSQKSPYTVGFTGQVKALVRRQFQMRLQDRFQLITSFALNTVLAIVIGVAFFRQPLTSQGAFTRGSTIFTALLNACLDAFGELPQQMLGRPILRKQTSFSFYRPGAIAIANTLSDIPFSAARLLIYDVIIYFMTGLDRSAGAFFTFHLINYMAFLTMQGFFRTFGLLCFNFDSAFRLATFFIPNMILYTGYMIPVAQMKRWLFWLYYINPIGYPFVGLMENEFSRITLTCDGNFIVPRNVGGVSKYPSALGPNQACTLFGAQPGSDIVTGKEYLKAGYDMNTADLWRRNFLVLVGYFFFLQLTQVLALEYYPQFRGGSAAVNIYAAQTAETAKLDKALQDKKADRQRNRDLKDDSEKPLAKTDLSHRKTFTWENLNYHVPVPAGQRRLLHDVFGYVKPGTLTALMGASGAGKTTCLDVLAQRKNIGVVTGDVLVDGRPLDSDFARGTAYAEQMDVHEGTATVREAMRFSAYLRQPFSVSREEKDAYVEEMIELLELQDLADALVMSLSMESRKRLTIGVELASKPELLLFLDEPTSGLDAQSAWNLVRFLRKLADQGQAILCTIHQPSSLLFESFDRLLLLKSGGDTVYFGDIGKDSHVLRDYFARNGAVCPSNVNPAEFMLEAIGAGVTPRIGPYDWADIWRESPECKRAAQEIKDIKAEALSHPVADKTSVATYATPFVYQLKTVVQRNNMTLWRSPDYAFTRLFVHAFISLFVSLSFLQLGTSVRDLQYRVFGIFWVVVLPAIIMSQAEVVFIFNRRVFIRESSSRIYSPYVFAIAQLLGEMPYSALCAVVYWLLMVYPMGFGKGSAGQSGVAFQLVPILLMELFGVTFGQLLGAISPSVQIAVLFNPFVMLVLATFCGVTIPFPQMAKFWRAWLYQLTPFTRAISTVLATELHGLVIKCKSEEFIRFSPPSGNTCSQWAQDFVNVAGGYLDNPNDTDSCRYCQYAVGDQYFEPLNIRYGNRWRDVGILLSFCIFNLIATIIASRVLRYAKR